MAGENGWSIWDILGFAYGVYSDQNPRDPKQTPLQMTPEQRAMLERYMGTLDNYQNTAGGTSDYLRGVINQYGQNADFSPNYASEQMKGQKLPPSPFQGQQLFPQGGQSWGQPQGNKPNPFGNYGSGRGGTGRGFNRDMDIAPLDGGWSSDYYNNPFNVGSGGGSQYSFGPNGEIIDSWGTSRGNPGVPTGNVPSTRGTIYEGPPPNTDQNAFMQWLSSLGDKIKITGDKIYAASGALIGFLILGPGGAVAGAKIGDQIYDWTHKEGAAPPPPAGGKAGAGAGGL